jgi:ankyrin repeat protein
MRRVLPQGAIDIRGPSGNTPLFESVLKHHVHSVALLLKRGANPRLINVDGCDALDAAAFGGCAMCAHALIEAGLDPKTVHHDGFNALHRAIWGDTPQHTETVKVILEAGVSPSMIA